MLWTGHKKRFVREESLRLYATAILKHEDNRKTLPYSRGPKCFGENLSLTFKYNNFDINGHFPQFNSPLMFLKLAGLENATNSQSISIFTTIIPPPPLTQYSQHFNSA